MRKEVKLPLAEPQITAYQYLGSLGACLANNPSINNWLINKATLLRCTKRFLKGYSAPEIAIEGISIGENPYFEKGYVNFRYLGGYVNVVIKNLIDDGYYIHYSGIDDYYMEGKSFYRSRHFDHDGLIYGYNSINKTYNILGYNEKWLYGPMEISQKCFERGRLSSFERGCYGTLCIFKPKEELVKVDVKLILSNLEKYIDSNLKKYPLKSEDKAYGIVVYDYLCIYLKKLFIGEIPHEKMDFRIFRLVWEYEKLMKKRLFAVEETLGMEHTYGEQYEKIVKIADDIRMMYASYHIKERKGLLPIIENKLRNLIEEEKTILKRFLNAAKKEVKKGALDKT